MKRKKYTKTIFTKYKNNDHSKSTHFKLRFKYFCPSEKKRYAYMKTIFLKFDGHTDQINSLPFLASGSDLIRPLKENRTRSLKDRIWTLPYKKPYPFRV